VILFQRKGPVQRFHISL